MRILLIMIIGLMMSNCSNSSYVKNKKTITSPDDLQKFINVYCNKNKQIIIVLVIGNDDGGPILRHIFPAFQRPLHTQDCTPETSHNPRKITVVIRIEGPCRVEHQREQADDRHTQPSQQFSDNTHATKLCSTILAHKCTPTLYSGNSVNLFRLFTPCRGLDDVPQWPPGVDTVERVTGHQ